MGAVARSFVAGSVMLVAACASLAGLEDPDPTGPTDVATPPSGNTSGGAVPAVGTPGGGEPGPNDDAPGPEAGALDAAGEPPAPACLPPKRPNGESCTTSADCCSNACSENARCRGSCKSSSLNLCNVFDDECCLGFFCSAELPPRCRKCRGTGESPQNNNPKTCCSRALDGDGKCQ